MPISEETGFRKIGGGGKVDFPRSRIPKKKLEISQGWIWRIWATFSNPLQVPVGVFGLLKGTFFFGEKNWTWKIEATKKHGNLFGRLQFHRLQKCPPGKDQELTLPWNWIIHWARRSFCLIFFWGFVYQRLWEKNRVRFKNFLVLIYCPRWS